MNQRNESLREVIDLVQHNQKQQIIKRERELQIYLRMIINISLLIILSSYNNFEAGLVLGVFYWLELAIKREKYDTKEIKFLRETNLYTSFIDGFLTTTSIYKKKQNGELSSSQLSTEQTIAFSRVGLLNTLTTPAPQEALITQVFKLESRKTDLLVQNIIDEESVEKLFSGMIGYIQLYPSSKNSMPVFFQAYSEFEAKLALENGFKEVCVNQYLENEIALPYKLFKSTVFDCKETAIPLDEMEKVIKLIASEKLHRLLIIIKKEMLVRKQKVLFLELRKLIKTELNKRLIEYSETEVIQDRDESSDQYMTKIKKVKSFECVISTFEPKLQIRVFENGQAISESLLQDWIHKRKKLTSHRPEKKLIEIANLAYLFSLSLVEHTSQTYDKYQEFSSWKKNLKTEKYYELKVFRSKVILLIERLTDFNLSSGEYGENILSIPNNILPNKLLQREAKNDIRTGALKRLRQNIPKTALYTTIILSASLFTASGIKYTLNANDNNSDVTESKIDNRIRKATNQNQWKIIDNGIDPNGYFVESVFNEFVGSSNTYSNSTDDFDYNDLDEAIKNFGVKDAKSKPNLELITEVKGYSDDIIIPIKAGTQFGTIDVSPSTKISAMRMKVYDNKALVLRNTESTSVKVHVYLVDDSYQPIPKNHTKITPAAWNEFILFSGDEKKSDELPHFNTLDETTTWVNERFTYNKNPKNFEALNDIKGSNNLANALLDLKECECEMCNTLAIILGNESNVLTDNQEKSHFYNYAIGYYNANDTKYLSGGEGHAFLIDNRGKILDATPSIESIKVEKSIFDEFYDWLNNSRFSDDLTLEGTNRIETSKPIFSSKNTSKQENGSKDETTTIKNIFEKSITGTTVLGLSITALFLLWFGTKKASFLLKNYKTNKLYERKLMVENAPIESVRIASQIITDYLYKSNNYLAKYSLNLVSYNKQSIQEIIENLQLNTAIDLKKVSELRKKTIVENFVKKYNNQVFKETIILVTVLATVLLEQ
jgi:hypothetical protein